MADDHIIIERRVEPILTPRVIVTIIAFTLLFGGLLIVFGG